MKQLLSLLALLAVSLAAHAQESKVYYPAASTAPASVAAAPAAHGSPVATSLFYLLFLAGLGAITYALWRRKAFPQLTAPKAASSLNIINTRPLGNRQFLVVVQYQGKEILLGVGPGFINKLESQHKDVSSCQS